MAAGIREGKSKNHRVSDLEYSYFSSKGDKKG